MYSVVDAGVVFSVLLNQRIRLLLLQKFDAFGLERGDLFYLFHALNRKSHAARFESSLFAGGSVVLGELFSAFLFLALGPLGSACRFALPRVLGALCASGLKSRPVVHNSLAKMWILVSDGPNGLRQQRLHLAFELGTYKKKEAVRLKCGQDETQRV